ncbi:MAG: alpha/beta fold hydrolase [Acidimicrobiales bacterium]|jgi:2-succinyl-6-hydroxy-2,4-cyclohexadiene-1-carboxylate synthase
MSLLSVRREGSGSVFVWLHGFTQTRASAHQFRSILAGSHELLTPDLPGHGDSCAFRATLEECADFVAAVMPEGAVDLGGYSFGARVSLHVALRHPQKVRKLILLGATRGIEDETQRLERRRHDESLAERIELLGVEEFLDEWLAQPMFAALPHDPLERAARSRDAAGLADSLRFAGTGTQAWLGPMLGTVTADTLALAGANDQKFAGEARAIANGVPQGSFAFIDSAGHAAHLEQPHATARLVEAFLGA